MAPTVPPTRNRWVPISCNDVANLEKRHTGFFLLQHRIEFVYMAGWIEQQRYPSQPLYLLSDRTGDSVLVLLPGHDPKASVLGKFIKLYGRKTPKEVVAHRWSLEDTIPFQEEIGLYYEASRIRENLFTGQLDNIHQDTRSHRWISEYQFPSFDLPMTQFEPQDQNQNQSKNSSDPVQKPYTIAHPPIDEILSLSRGSLLARHPSFHQIAAIADTTATTTATTTAHCEPSLRQNIDTLRD